MEKHLSIWYGLCECAIVETAIDHLGSHFVLTFRYAYLEYANEEEAYEASEKYKDAELESEKLYVIKAIAEKKEKYGESV